MKKKRVYKLLYGVMSAMLSLQEKSEAEEAFIPLPSPEGEGGPLAVDEGVKESREQSTADFVEGDSSPSAQNDVFSSCPPLGGRDKGEGEEKSEEEIPSSVGEPTASPRGEAEEGTQGEAEEEPQGEAEEGTQGEAEEEPQGEAEAEAEEEQDFSAQAAPLVEMIEAPEEVTEQPEEEETVILRTQSEESREQSTADFVEGDSSPSAQNDGESTAQNDVFSSCPPLGGRDKGEGEEAPEEEAEIPSSVTNVTASPQGEAEEEVAEQPEEEDSSVAALPQNDEESAAQNDVFSSCPPLGGRDKGEGEEAFEKEGIPSSVTNVTASPQGEAEEEVAEQPEEEEIDLRAPTVDGLRFEWREGTKSYTVTGLAEDNKEAAQAIIPQELFGYLVTEIGENSFRGCRSLTEVVIPEGVTKIGDRAFYGCYALERIELPDSLTSVGDEVFYLCMAITSQTEFDNAYYIGNRKNPYVLLSVHKAGDISSCVVHKSTKFIDRGAFAECRALEKIEIPGGVLGIGCKAFYNCSALESVHLGSGLVHIGESAFYGCLSLRGARFSGAREAWERIEIEENNEPLFPPAFLS